MTPLRRLLHVSDLHFGPKHRPEVSAAIEERIAAERPDLVVISGDLTQRAKPAQFRAAREFVERVERSSPAIVVPGNHDVPLWRVWERVFAPFGAWRRHFGRELEPVFRDELLLVAGVNTAQAWAFKGGRVRRRRIRELERLFHEVPAEPRKVPADSPLPFRIVVAHHHWIRPTGLDCEHPSWGARLAANRLAPRGVELVLSGHLHQTLELFPAGADGFPALHTGTSSSSRGRGPEAGRNSLNWIEVGATSFRVEGRLWNPAAARFEPFLERRYRRRFPAARAPEAIESPSP